MEPRISIHRKLIFKSDVCILLQFDHRFRLFLRARIRLLIHELLSKHKSDILICFVPNFPEPSASQEDEQQSSAGADETAETKSDDSRGAEESTESIEASSEQPRGLGKLPKIHFKSSKRLNMILLCRLGLLGNRRRLQMRRPGTIL